MSQEIDLAVLGTDDAVGGPSGTPLSASLVDVLTQTASAPPYAGLMAAATAASENSVSWLGGSALSTNATSGFAPIPTMAGTPSGAPASTGAATPIAINSTTGEIVHYSGGAWHGIGATYSVMMPLPTGDTTGALDHANWVATEAACPDGGKILVRNGTYYTNATCTSSKGISIEGESCRPVFGSMGGGSFQPFNFPVTPFLKGAVFVQVTANTDVFNFTGTAQTVNLRSLGAMFAAAIANTTTGHHFVQQPPTYLTGHDSGLMYSHWENVWGYGGDGSHYTIKLTNPGLNTFVHCGGWGGGILQIIGDSAVVDVGNSDFYHLNGSMQNAGTADAVQLVASTHGTSAGGLGIMNFYTPGIQVTGAANLGGSTQKIWNDLGGAAAPGTINIYNEDLESYPNAANASVFGPYTQRIGIGINDYLDPNFNTTYGRTYGGAVAGGSFTTAKYNSIFGSNTGLALSSGQQNVLAGYNVAPVATTLSNSVLVGAACAPAVTSATGLTGLGQASGTLIQDGTDHVWLGRGALASMVHGSGATAIGTLALNLYTGTSGSVAVGDAAGHSFSSGAYGVFMGGFAGYAPAGITANATTTATGPTFVGYESGGGSTTQFNYPSAYGYFATTNGNYAGAFGANTSAGASGALALGTDNTGAGATTAVANQIALGTGLHTTLIAGSLVVGSGALATNATSGFLNIPTCAGAPTGTPTAHTGTVPLVFDTTDSRLYVYTGGAWSDAFTA